MRAYVPDDIESLKELLKKLPKETSFIAGGTDWIIKHRRSWDEPKCIVSLMKVRQMREISETEDGLFIGACRTMTELERDHRLSGGWRVIAEAAASVGSQQIRNRATIGGNIANAAPAADMAPALICACARASVLGRDLTVTEYQMEDFIIGREKTALAPGDVLLGFHLPGCAKNTVSHYHKLGFRKEPSISRFGIALSLRIEQGVVADISAAVGSIGSKAVRLPQAEETLKGRPLSRETAQNAGRALEDYIRATSGRKYKAWASVGVMTDALSAFKDI